MKLVVSKTGLTYALSLMSNIAEQRQDSIAGAVRIEAKDGELRLAAVTSLAAISTKIPAEIEEEGLVMAPARVVSTFARTSLGADVAMHTEDNFLVFSHKNATLKVILFPDDDFMQQPAAPPPDVAVVPGPTLAEAIAKASPCAMQDDVGSVHEGLRFKTIEGLLTVTATDRHRALIMTLGEADQPIDVVIPRRVAMALRRFCGHEEEVVVGGDDNRMSFRFGTTVLRSRLMNGGFAEVEKLLYDTPVGTRVVVNALDLAESVSRLKAVLAFGEKDSLTLVHVQVGERELLLRAMSPVGSFEERIEAEVEGPLIVDVAMQVGLFIYPLTMVDEDKATLWFVTKRNNTYLVNSGAWSYVAMPIVGKVSPPSV